PNDSYCVRVLARSDDDAQHAQVTSEWTYLNGYDNPAFTFTPPPAGSTCAVTPASAYRLPINGSATPRTPYFTWDPVSGAGSYYVVVARDSGFTHVVDVGFTDVNAYAPRLASGTPLSDETTAYYWAVMPATSAGGAGVCSDPAHDSPQGLNWSPTETFVRRLPVPSPTHESTTNEGIPPFSWTPVQGASSYDVHVEQADGTTKDFNFESPSFTVAKYYGIGIVHLQVRAAFPT